MALTLYSFYLKPQYLHSDGLKTPFLEGPCFPVPHDIHVTHTCETPKHTGDRQSIRVLIAEGTHHFKLTFPFQLMSLARGTAAVCQQGTMGLS